MKETLRYGFILGTICIVAGGLLAGINFLTKPRIIAQAQAEEESALKEVMPEGESFEPAKKENGVIYYRVRDKEGKYIGAAFKASGKGYSSAVDTLAGMSPDGQIIAVKVLSQNETPGLGANVVEPPFTGQFAGKNIQDLEGVQAITGATISSKAVIDSVREKGKEIFELIKDEK
ncbi:MAG: RnfABCDGE type electron transport complex subunit G [Candidatus Omnitrophica bacterium]|nr:RnfABCDGE type electron transport complex subunit G [Candidatus Omnitrophota bacterium]MDD5552350.1 RnfABCDGE type electron transport complex subunit G [Candidatus Omnitrophota bacterium]